MRCLAAEDSSSAPQGWTFLFTVMIFISIWCGIFERLEQRGYDPEAVHFGPDEIPFQDIQTTHRQRLAFTA